ncbi:tungstate transport system ATP-binding protein [Desulfocicer vacuolatum DSM 3385]|uniref:Tungstate transport system ATP-binding protein n=2 Tax=Desulfocicer vacuolatum TaxID=2298 RepID=A0A1W2BF98_9BACT|nr:tungstate transport system ATP-binding protein [Desulfocicer vacuolatum DSM 3385]
MATSSIYLLKNIVQAYKGKTALDIPNLSIAPGSITGLMGPNGSGKSTLLKLLAFVSSPVKGTLFFNGKEEVPFSPKVRFDITLLTQTPYLLKRSVHDNITHGLKIRGKAHGRKDPTVCRQVRNVMARVGLSHDEFAHRMDYELSGGEAQRVAMAARLILKPRVLLLDEPTASVDVNSAALIRRAALYARKTWGTTIIIASHDHEWLQGACDRLLQLYHGKIFQAGSKNIIPGPFVRDDKGFYRPLSANGSGQTLRLTTPPHDKASALLKTQDINITVREPSLSTKKKLKKAPDIATAPSIQKSNKILKENKFHTIEGKVLRLMGDKKRGHITMVIKVNEMNFTIQMAPETVIQCKLLPGARVMLTYCLSDIEWI